MDENTVCRVSSQLSEPEALTSCFSSCQLGRHRQIQQELKQQTQEMEGNCAASRTTLDSTHQTGLLHLTDAGYIL